MDGLAPTSSLQTLVRFPFISFHKAFLLIGLLLKRFDFHKGNFSLIVPSDLIWFFLNDFLQYLFFP